MARLPARRSPASVSSQSANKHGSHEEFVHSALLATHRGKLGECCHRRTGGRGRSPLTGARSSYPAHARGIAVDLKPRGSQTGNAVAIQIALPSHELID